MNIKDGLVLRNIGGRQLVVSSGQNDCSFHEMITLTGIGAFIWNKLSENCNEAEIINAVAIEYDVDPERARVDVSRFLKKLKTAGMLDES